MSGFVLSELFGPFPPPVAGMRPLPAVPLPLLGELAKRKCHHVSGRRREKTGHFSLLCPSWVLDYHSVFTEVPASIRQTHNGSCSQWPLALILSPPRLRLKVDAGLPAAPSVCGAGNTTFHISAAPSRMTSTPFTKFPLF